MIWFWLMCFYIIIKSLKLSLAESWPKSYIMMIPTSKCDQLYKIFIVNTWNVERNSISWKDMITVIHIRIWFTDTLKFQIVTLKMTLKIQIYNNFQRTCFISGHSWSKLIVLKWNWRLVLKLTVILNVICVFLIEIINRIKYEMEIFW
jgi:hypothetical protein